MNIYIYNFYRDSYRIVYQQSKQKGKSGGGKKL